ncbi:MAG: ribosome maturation factor RimM [Burkholderiaceae bacterium]
MNGATANEEFIELGRVLGAYGVRGVLRVRVPSGRDSILPSLTRVSLVAADRSPQVFDIAKCRWHGEHLLLTLSTLTDRDLAAGWRGAAVCARRADFPPAAKDEFYWIDLIGCEVVNRQGLNLGVVESVDEHGAAPFVTVRGQAEGEGAASHLIPLVPAYVSEIDLAARILRVDWQPDWS